MSDGDKLTPEQIAVVLKDAIKRVEEKLGRKLKNDEIEAAAAAAGLNIKVYDVGKN